MGTTTAVMDIEDMHITINGQHIRDMNGAWTSTV